MTMGYIFFKIWLIVISNEYFDPQWQLLTKMLNSIFLLISSRKKSNYDSNFAMQWKLKLAGPAADFTIFWQRVRFVCSQSKRCIKMQHFLSFLYLLTPTDEFLFEVEYYTANNLHPCKLHVILTVMVKSQTVACFG